MKLDDTIEVMERLTKSEKRSLSIAISRTSKSEEPTEQHFRLYNILSSIIKDAEKADPLEKDAVIEKGIEQARAQHPKLFASLNVIRLYDFIFAVIRSINADKEGFRLDNYLQDIQVLQDKKLGHQVLGLIEKAKREARESEAFLCGLKILQFLMLERKVHLTINKGKDFGRLKKLRQACGLQYRRIKDVLDTMDDQEVVQCYSNKGRIPDEVIDEASPVFKLLLKKPEEKEHLPLDAALRGLHTTSLYLKRDRLKHPEDFEKMFSQAGHMIGLFKGNEPRKAQNRRYYLQSLMALANACIETGRRQPFDEYLDEFKLALGIDPARPVEQEIAHIDIDKHTSRDYYTLIHVFTSYYLGTGNWSLAVRIIRQIKGALEIYKPPTGHLMAMYWLMGSVYFLTKDYRSSRHYVDKLQDKAFTLGEREDITFQARLLDLLLVYESSEENESRLLLERIGRMYTTLSKPPGEDEKGLVAQNMAQNALAILHTLSATFSSTGQANTLEEFRKLYDKLTSGMGDFITSVFALWARQKMQSPK